MKKYKVLVSMLAAFGLFMSAPSGQFVARAAEKASTADELADEEAEAVEAEEAVDDRIIPKGITIEGQSVSGKTVTEANKIVAKYFSAYDNVQFTLSANDQTISAVGKDLCIGAKNSDVTVKAATYGSYGNLGERFKAKTDLKEGRTKDFKLSLGANRAGITSFLDIASSQVNDEACDDYLTRENDQFVFHEGKSGVVVQIDESAAILVNYIENKWDGKAATVDLATVVREPRGSKEELAEIKDLIGSFTTDYSSSASNRKNNVSNGVSFIDGTILYPGDKLSVLRTITPFTAENGYMLAGSYENGTTVETYGGGICQVSTTLYGAVREAELEVDTRFAHSMLVTYVEPSMDAAISESGGKDFVIKNNKKYPVYIEGFCDGKTVNFNIYGKEEDSPSHQVVYEPEITSVVVQNTSWVPDGNAPLGKLSTATSGHTGLSAKLWKIVYEDGTEVSREVVNNSKYNPSNRTVTVGVASLDPNLSYAMLQAVATQDPNAIAAAVATYAPEVVNSTPYVITPKYSVTNPAATNSAPAEDAAPAQEQAPAEVPEAAPEAPPEGIPAPESPTNTDI
ncbi:MAG: VanW family protein [Pseudobutyrivibrio sp.]|nr:VanW family protein [Pseudobutyrivibrio sp.]